MKNKLITTLLLVFAFVGITSCEVEPLDPAIDTSVPEYNETFFAVTFLGEYFNTSNATASVEAGELTIRAVKGNRVFLLVSQGALVGTYNNNQTNMSYTVNGDGNSVVYNSIHPLTLTSNSSLTVTDINTSTRKISGKFNFKAYSYVLNAAPSDETPTNMVLDEINFVDGVFYNVSYANGIVDNGGGNNGGNDNGGVSSGDYFPLAVNNQWFYSQTQAGETSNYDYKVISQQTIGGVSYYKLNNLMSAGLLDQFDGDINVQAFVRKNNGDYFQRSSISVVDPTMGMNITVEPYEYIFLKDNLDEGQSWTQTVPFVSSITMMGETFPVEETILINSSIVAKNISLTVNGTTFTNVIHVNQSMTVSGEETVSQFWFAKDVGMIKSISIGENGEETSTLTNYILN